MLDVLDTLLCYRVLLKSRKAFLFQTQKYHSECFSKQGLFQVYELPGARSATPNSSFPVGFTLPLQPDSSHHQWDVSAHTAPHQGRTESQDCSLFHLCGDLWLPQQSGTGNSPAKCVLKHPNRLLEPLTALHKTQSPLTSSFSGMQ